MIYLESPSTDPRFNLALEEYVFDAMDPAQDYFMLWQNDNAVIVGKFQNTLEEIDQCYVRRHSIQVVRRLSGGGAVYHDLGNLNFTFITGAGDTSSIDFGFFCNQIVRALSAFGITANVSGRNDMTINGYKFSGNAQYIKRGRVMHHGTLLFDSNLERMTGALRASKGKFESKGIRSIRSRVGNIKGFLKQDTPLEQFKRELLDNMFGTAPLCPHIFTRDELDKVAQLQKSRYNLWEWNYGASPQYSIRKQRRVEGCGTITLHMEVSKGVITAFHASGDYFGNGDPKTLATRMIGCRPETETLRRALDGMDITQFFSQLQQEDFINLVVE